MDARPGGLGLPFAIALVIASVLTGSGHASASSGTLWVNGSGSLFVPPGTSCANPGFSTIQSAVNAASSGDKISVCPGTYTEEVLIPAGKDSLQLRSVKTWQAVIKAPALMLGLTKSIVRVNGAQHATILAFTITGPGGFGCNSLRYGVRVDNGGSADILGNHIVDIRDDPFSGCQNGVAVLVGRQAESTTGSARIIGNVFERYQKNGPTVSNVGSFAEIAHNRVLGVGPTLVIAQNGIQVSGGATATVQHNFVSGHIYTPQAVVSTGILLFDPGAVTVAHNTITANDVGEYTFASLSMSSVAYNRVKSSTFDGLIVDESSSAQLAHNKSDHNAGPGIGFYGAQNSSMTDNHVENNVGSGILLSNDVNTSTGNVVNDNKVRTNGGGPADSTDGMRVEAGSTGNSLAGNHLRDNTTHDCHDFNVSGNAWTNNHGETSVPPGICGRDDNDAGFETSMTFGWDPTIAWYAGTADATDYDWAAAYATVDTDALLLLAAQLPLRVAHGRAVPSE
jgi:nitrous oxidase accessory protein NosD